MEPSTPRGGAIETANQGDALEVTSSIFYRNFTVEDIPGAGHAGGAAFVFGSSLGGRTFDRCSIFLNYEIADYSASQPFEGGIAGC